MIAIPIAFVCLGVLVATGGFGTGFNGVQPGFLAKLSLACLLGMVAFTLVNWRCPACSSPFGGHISPSTCPRCGLPLR